MIFEEQVARKPDHYPWTEEFMRAMWEGHWTDKEFSFTSDVHDFKVNLTEAERQIIVKCLSAIGQVEIAVKTFWAKLGDYLPHPSLRDMGYVMANIEVIHNNAYERLLEVLGLDDVFEQNLKLPWIQGRVSYLKKYIERNYADDRKQFIYALILFTLFVENVSLFSQFYVINWFGRKNLLKDTNQQTNYTAREEDIHAKVGIRLIQEIRKEHPDLFDDDLKQRISKEARVAYESEKVIIDWILSGYTENRLSSSILQTFIQHRINESLVSIGFSPIFDVNDEDLEKTIWFDEEVLGNSMTDFFYQRPVEYAKSNQSFDVGDLF
jgi:ribonucleoside-diphosphate reductase beta chain